MTDVFVATGNFNDAYVGLGETEELAAIDRFGQYLEGDDVVFLGVEKSHEGLWACKYRYSWEPDESWEFTSIITKRTVRTAK